MAEVLEKVVLEKMKNVVKELMEKVREEAVISTYLGYRRRLGQGYGRRAWRRCRKRARKRSL